MDNIKITLVYDRRKDGKNKLEIKVYFPNARRQLYYSTGISIAPENYDNFHGVIIPTHPDYNNVMAKIVAMTKKLQLLADSFSGTSIEEFAAYKAKTVNHLREDKNKTTNFIDFVEKELEASSELAKSTKVGHRRTLELLKDFNSVIYMIDVNYTFAQDFDRYLRTCFNNLNTIAKHHEHIKKYVTLARKRFLIPQDNYINYCEFKIKKQETENDILLPNEIEKLENLELDKIYNPMLLEVKEMFLFAYYTALRISDIQELNPSQHIKLVGENMVLEKIIYKLRKNNRKIKHNLSQIHNGKPEKLVNRFMPQANGRLFNSYHTGNANVYLKKVIAAAGIDKAITFHSARHSMLTMIAYKTGDVFSVMKYGGISNIQTAQKYIHLSNRLFDEKIAQIVWE